MSKKKPPEKPKRCEVNLTPTHIATAFDKAGLPRTAGNRNKALRYCIDAAPFKKQ